MLPFPIQINADRASLVRTLLDKKQLLNRLWELGRGGRAAPDKTSK